MDSDEVNLLTELGGWLLDNFAPLPLLLFFYGMHVLLFSIATSQFLRRPRTTPAWLVFVVTVIGLSLATIHIAGAIADYVKLIRSYLITYVQLPPDEQEDLGDRGQLVTSILSQWTTDLMPILSDVAVIWRCSVLYTEQKWVMAVPLFLLMASIVTTFTFLVLVSTVEGYQSIMYDGGSKQNLYYLYTTGVASSLATNVVATLLIGYKLWSYRRDCVVDNAPRSKGTPVSNILAMLVESGVMFCCLQAVFLVVDNVPQIRITDAGYIIDDIYYAGYTALAAMYPTILAVLVHSQQSIADIYPSMKGRDFPIDQVLEFAIPPSQSRELHSMRSDMTADEKGEVLRIKVTPSDDPS